MRGQFGDADITNAVAEILMDFQMDDDWMGRMYEALDEVMYTYMASYEDGGDGPNMRRLGNMKIIAELRAKIKDLQLPPDLYLEENDDLVFDIPAGYGRPDPEESAKEPGRVIEITGTSEPAE